MLTTNQSRALNQRYPKAAVTIADCITCHGKKTFWWRGPEDRYYEYDCVCEDQYLLHRYLLHCGVMRNYQTLGWQDCTHISGGTLGEISKYLDNRERYVDAGIGMTISGKQGNGKSMLAFLLLKRLIAEGMDCYATTFSDMIDNFAGGWQDRDQSRWFNSTVRNAGVLYVDDLGRERNRGIKSVGENMLETVVRSRVACSLPTILTTNLTQDDIEKGYGGHTMSLLSGCSISIEVVGPDRRRVMLQRDQAEVDAGLTRPIVVG